MAEGDRLENDLAAKSCHVGSNPTSSARELPRVVYHVIHWNLCVSHTYLYVLLKTPRFPCIQILGNTLVYNGVGFEP